MKKRKNTKVKVMKPMLLANMTTGQKATTPATLQGLFQCCLI